MNALEGINKIEESKFSNLSLGKKVLRILFSPIAFLWGVFLLIMLTIFPLPLMMMMSMVGLIRLLFLYLIRLSGANVKIDNEYAFIEYFNYPILNQLATLTIYLWGAFYIAIYFIRRGEILFTIF